MVRSEPRGAAGETYWAPSSPPRVLYDIDCQIEGAGEQLHLDGSETIRLHNDSGVPLPRLALTWPGNAALKRVTVDGEAADLNSGTSEDGEQLAVLELGRPVEPGQDASVEVEFKRSVPAEPQVCLAGWHPRLWWGFQVHADFAVRLAAPVGYAVGTSGSLDPEDETYRGNGIRDFGVFLGRDMEVLEADAGGTPVRAICTSRGESCARLLLDTAVDVVNCYREHFGFYPHSSLTIAPGMDRPAGGYPMASALVVVHGQKCMPDRPEDHWRWITAHEIGHEYWGEHVLVRPPAWWLLIGLGIYTDRQYWCSRGYRPERYRKRIEGYVATAEEGLETRFEISPQEERKLQFDYNSRIAHDKSYSVVSALECMIGSDALRKTAQRCLEEFAGRPMGTGEFQSVCEEETGLDLAWFFRQWVETDGVLCYRCTEQTCEKQGSRFLSSVAIKREGQIRMPIPVELTFEDGTSERVWTERLLDNNVLKFESASPLLDVTLDPDGRLPMLARVPGEGQKSLLRQVSELPWRGSAESARVLLQRAFELSLRQADLWGKLGMVVFDGGYFEDALSAFERCSNLAEPESHWSFAAPAWRGHLLDLLDRRDEALQAYRVALKRVGDRHVRHDQYGIKVDRAWIERRAQEPFCDPRSEG